MNGRSSACLGHSAMLDWCWEWLSLCCVFFHWEYPISMCVVRGWDEGFLPQSCPHYLRIWCRYIMHSGRHVESFTTSMWIKNSAKAIFEENDFWLGPRTWFLSEYYASSHTFIWAFIIVITAAMPFWAMIVLLRLHGSTSHHYIVYYFLSLIMKRLYIQGGVAPVSSLHILGDPFSWGVTETNYNEKHQKAAQGQ